MFFRTANSATSASAPLIELGLGVPRYERSTLSKSTRPALPAALQARPRPDIRRLSSRDLQWLPALCDLLTDSVHQGATLGFLAPLSRYAAMDYWHGVFARLGPHLSLWIACEGSEDGDGRPPQLQGVAQLSLCPHANAHHRGEVLGLMVHSRARGRGIASQLMTSVECAALQQGRTLLVLDTAAGSQAEAVYVHLGWQRAGEVPDYDSCADGRLHSTARYYKRLHMPALSDAR
ncbi:MAG: GNAT family N-acetyltransferase [Roseateles asaccharophilus]|uniref:Ribosomal protein S18 acetylase RimI-like enzyme n=1 Tax=Roseateles asaccharophilus TaxID=582607 RepID=A0A4R6MW49_9BURK|nr:GNAT family N-acetyltransferase [Roseateles asaccharophilus]MDN3546337.1 GNAT family N-acetyltransferase [Roseateles asaccharophilus]TDP04950.1 ribosomal protein S18 acetylase RimI-like enzyme [Roseateles asaccharophilus]